MVKIREGHLLALSDEYGLTSAIMSWDRPGMERPLAERAAEMQPWQPWWLFLTSVQASGSWRGPKFWANLGVDDGLELIALVEDSVLASWTDPALPSPTSALAALTRWILAPQNLSSVASIVDDCFVPFAALHLGPSITLELTWSLDERALRLIADTWQAGLRATGRPVFDGYPSWSYVQKALASFLARAPSA